VRITATFLDEISHDIPSQNWGRKEWARDFAAMKAIGIDTVVLIRCGYKRWMTYRSEALLRERGGYEPPVELVPMFLELAEKHGMSLFFGTYDSGEYWLNGEHQKEIDINQRVIDEAWTRFGSSPSFKGWYLSLEVSRRQHGIINIYRKLAEHCKQVSGNLPTLISPYIEGRKAISAFSASVARDAGGSLAQHEKEWSEIMAGIAGAVDIVAFQDGHVSFHELPDYLSVNRTLAEKHGLECWTNVESFDRDMPIKFLPIKWEKMRLKLNAAEKAGVRKAVTFEFSHFMSPNSCYPQAHGLYDRYREHLGILNDVAT